MMIYNNYNNHKLKERIDKIDKKIDKIISNRTNSLPKILLEGVLITSILTTFIGCATLGKVFSERNMRKIPIAKGFYNSKLLSYDRSMKKEMKRLTEHTFSETEWAKTIYDHFIDNLNLAYTPKNDYAFRAEEFYHSDGVAVAFGKWKEQTKWATSRTTRETKLMKVGDCMDISSLYLSLCKSIGIKGKLAYVKLEDNVKLGDDIRLGDESNSKEEMNVFHIFVVANLDGQTVVIDPSLDLPIVKKGTFGVYEMVFENKPVIELRIERNGFDIKIDKEENKVYSGYNLLSNIEVDSFYYYEQGICLLRMGEIEKSKELFKKAFELNPNNKLVKEALNLMEEFGY